VTPPSCDSRSPQKKCIAVDSSLIRANKSEHQALSDLVSVFTGELSGVEIQNCNCGLIIESFMNVCFEYVHKIMTKSDVLKLMELVSSHNPTLVNDLVPVFLSVQLGLYLDRTVRIRLLRTADHHHLFDVSADFDSVDAQRERPERGTPFRIADPGTVRQCVYGYCFRIQPPDGLCVVSDRVCCDHGHWCFGRKDKKEKLNKKERSHGLSFLYLRINRNDTPVYRKKHTL